MINKFTKLIYNPKILMTIWVFFLTSPLVDTLNLFLLQKLSASNLRLGLIFSVFHKVYLPIFSVFVILFFILWYINILSPNLLTRGHHMMLLSIGLSSIVYNISVQLLLNLEQINYSNFLYSRFGLRPETLSFVSIVNLIIIAIIISFYVTLLTQSIVNKKTKIKYIFNFNIYISLIGLTVSIALSLYPFLNIFRLFHEVKQSYSERLGPSYSYVQALVDSSPDNSTVIHPPQSQNWPLVGNQPVIRYFLFPRILVSGALITNQSTVEKLNDLYFVKIFADANAPEWPTIDKAKNTIIFDQINKIKYKSLNLVRLYNGKEIYTITFK